MQFTFKIGAKIKEAWPIYKENFGTLLLLTVITAIVKIIGSSDNWTLIILSFIVGLLLSYIWIRFILDLVDKKESNPFSKKAIPTFLQFWNFIKTVILSSLCILAGFILFIVPGLYISGRLMFAIYLSIEKNQGARVTIKEAWNMTKGYGWKLFWKSFVIGLFMVAGFIVFFVGGLITYPLGLIVLIMMYNEFLRMKMQFPLNTAPISANTDEKKEEVKEDIQEEKKEEGNPEVNH